MLFLEAPKSYKPPDDLVKTQTDLNLNFWTFGRTFNGFLETKRWFRTKLHNNRNERTNMAHINLESVENLARFRITWSFVRKLVNLNRFMRWALRRPERPLLWDGWTLLIVESERWCSAQVFLYVLSLEKEGVPKTCLMGSIPNHNMDRSHYSNIVQVFCYKLPYFALVFLGLIFNIIFQSLFLYVFSSFQINWIWKMEVSNAKKLQWLWEKILICNYKLKTWIAKY